MGLIRRSYLIEYYLAIQNDQYEEIPTVLREKRRAENYNYVLTAKEKCLYDGLKIDENINK